LQLASSIFFLCILTQITTESVDMILNVLRFQLVIVLFCLFLTLFSPISLDLLGGF